MKQNKKGFTLIELLAVIVILAIIALIAVPVIMNIINKSNKSAFKDTAYGVISAGELYFYLTGKEFVNYIDKPVPYFNYKTKYAEWFGGSNGYIRTKEMVLEDIKKYVSEMRGKL